MISFSKGDQIKDRHNSREGVIMQAGPEVSVVLWNNGMEQAEINKYLKLKMVRPRLKLKLRRKVR